MEVRGLGLINIRDLFGVASTRTSKRVELVVQLERWDPSREYDRLGLDDAFFELLGLQVPLIRMPVAPGRNLAILVEVAARNQLLRTRGINAARELAARLDAELERAPHPMPRRATRASERRRRRSAKRRACREQAAHARHALARRFIVVTGMSGAGKSHAIRALEDLGYYCVDNLPVSLIPVLADLRRAPGREHNRVAVVMDVREPRFVRDFPRVWRRLKTDRRPRHRAGLPRSRATRRCCAASARRGGRIRWRPIGRSPKGSTRNARRCADPRAWPTRSSTRRI